MSTQLRELFGAAADSQTPDDLAGRAVAGARRRRQQRFTVASSVAAVTVLVAGAVVVGSLQRTSDEPRPQDVASQPSELPAPEGLPELTAGAMDAASVAYVVDDQLVLVDAATGEPATWDGIPVEDLTVAFFDPELAGSSLRPFQVRLSPDGTTALVAVRFESSQQLLGIRMAVLDVASADASVEDLQLADAYAESSWLEYNLIAWAPNSKSAYCVCLGGDGTDPELGVWSLTFGDAPIDTFYSLFSDLAPTQISAGTGRVAVQLEPGGEWTRLDDQGELVALADLEPAIQAALSHGEVQVVAGVSNSRYGIEDVDRFPFRVAWHRLPAGPVSSIQALGTDFVLVSRPLGGPSGEPAPPSPLIAHRLTQDADPQLLTTFPAGTTSTSFAADRAISSAP